MLYHPETEFAFIFITNNLYEISKISCRRVYQTGWNMLIFVPHLFVVRQLSANCPTAVGQLADSRRTVSRQPPDNKKMQCFFNNYMFI
jgi:hypothetical protein